MFLAGRKMGRLGLLVIAAVALQLAAAPSAFAWGDAGHKIVCQLAYLELTPAAKSKVDALIALDPKFRTFATSCTWPDIFPAVRPAEHFLNVPRSARTIEPANLCPMADRCVASAILNDARDLATAQDAQRKVAAAQKSRPLGRRHSSAVPCLVRGRQGCKFHRGHRRLRRQSAPRLGYVHRRKEIGTAKRPSRRRSKARSRTRTAKSGRPRASMPPPSPPGRTNCWSARKAPSLNIASGTRTAAGTRLTSGSFPGRNAKSRSPPNTWSKRLPSSATGSNARASGSARY